MKKNVIIYCEGYTEESFVNEVLAPYFKNIDIKVLPQIHQTKKTGTGPVRGGVSKYEPIKTELIRYCKNPNFVVTTMFDYYGMPKDTPAISCTEADIYKRVETIESAIADDIGYNNFIPNLIMHEFEGLLFSDPQSFILIAKSSEVAKLQKIRNKAQSPEHINNSPDTAPSKRIRNIINDYGKVRQGIIVAKNIGIDKMLSECKHFAAWIENIKNFKFPQ